MRARLLRALLAVCAALVAAALGSHPALAHNQPFSIFDLEVGTAELRARLTVHRDDAARELGVPADSMMASTYLQRVAPRLALLLGPRLEVAADGVVLAPRLLSAAPLPDGQSVALSLRYRAARPPGTVRVRGPLVPGDSQHETFLNVFEAGKLRQQEVLTRGRPEVRFFTGTRQGALAVVGTFLAAGVHHICIGPDHILFIVGLLLLGGGFGRLLKIVTAFTVAHSITLALATLGVVNPPSRVIEPAIALSIVYVGLDNLRARSGGRDLRALIAFGFGFVHGFGFAGVLREFGLPQAALGWSLFSFNLGVEVGQACIVATGGPLLALVSARAPRNAPRVVTVGSWTVALAGAYWLVERVIAPR